MVSILVVGEKIGYGRIGIDISVLSIKSALMAHIRTNRVKGSPIQRAGTDRLHKGRFRRLEAILHSFARAVNACFGQFILTIKYIIVSLADIYV